MAHEGAPVAVGAVGGSGTRVVARFLEDAGYYLGSDLNESHDNLWFTLFFKRPGAPDDGQARFDRLADLFLERMRGIPPSADDIDAGRILSDLSAIDRPQHPAEWLQQRRKSFLAHSSGEPSPPALWGWKEPNTHVVVDRLLDRDPALRYIHVVRNGLDMAFNRNQNQLAFWGSRFLGRAVDGSPRDSLAYWCAVQRRMEAVAARHEGRVLFLDFDAMCLDPAGASRKILDFCRISGVDAAVERFRSSVRPPASTGVFRDRDLAGLDPRDIEFVRSRGFVTS